MRLRESSDVPVAICRPGGKNRLAASTRGSEPSRKLERTQPAGPAALFHASTYASCGPRSDHRGRWARIVEPLPAFRLGAGLARAICVSQGSIQDSHWNSLPSQHTAGANCLPQEGVIDVIRMPRTFITGSAGSVSMLRHACRWVGRSDTFGKVPVAIPCVSTKVSHPTIGLEAPPAHTLTFWFVRQPTLSGIFSSAE